MAAAPKPAPPAPLAAEAHLRKPALRPDLSTLAGIAVAFTGIIGGLLLEKGNIQDVAQATAAMIVLGGTLGAVLVTTPLPVFLRAVKGLRWAFMEQASSTAATIESLIQYATKARKNGIVSLESEAAHRPGPVSPQGPQPGGGWHRFAGTPQNDGAGPQPQRAHQRGGGQSVGGGRRLCPDHRNHRRRDGADSGDETPGRHRGRGPRHCGGLFGHGVWSRIGQPFLPAGGQ